MVPKSQREVPTPFLLSFTLLSLHLSQLLLAVTLLLLHPSQLLLQTVTLLLLYLSQLLLLSRLLVPLRSLQGTNTLQLSSESDTN